MQLEIALLYKFPVQSSLCKCTATLGAAVWFFMTVYSFMLLKITSLSEFVVALGAVV